VGTPTLVPEPRTVIRSGVTSSAWPVGGFVGDMDETESQLGERILQQTLLFKRKVAFSLFQQHAQHVDGVARDGQIGLRLRLRPEVHEAELNFGLRAQREHQERE